MGRTQSVQPGVPATDMALGLFKGLVPEEQAPPPGLAEFVRLTAGFEPEPWQRLICERLERLRHERGVRLLLHAPPQFGKSIILSQRYPAWLLGVVPTARVRLACYNVTQAERFSKINRDLMQEKLYAHLFPNPDCRIPPVVSAEEWSTTARERLKDAQPSFKSLGLASGFTGMGASLLIIDDPYASDQEARSEAVNAALWSWWSNTASVRLGPDANVVVMFHRYWEGDFAGKLLEDKNTHWEVMRFPAICDGKPDDPTVVAGLRKEGESLSPRYTVEHLEGIRAGPTNFAALFQGTPLPAEGGLFKDQGKDQIVPVLPESNAPVSRVRHWDLAGATTKRADETVGLLMARLADGRYAIEHVVHGKWDPATRDQIILQTANDDRARPGPRTLQLVPKDAGAAGLAQAGSLVRLLAGHTVKTILESGSKETRADPLASQWNAGNVLLLNGAWVAPLLSQFLTFPNGTHDDFVDSGANAFNELTSQMGTLPYAWLRNDPVFRGLAGLAGNPNVEGAQREWTPSHYRAGENGAAREFLVDTADPAALDATLRGMGAVLVDNGTQGDYARRNGHYIARAIGDPGYVRFALQRQGYARLVEESA